jgi:hypothetical protein
MVALTGVVTSWQVAMVGASDYILSQEAESGGGARLAFFI